LGIAYLPKGIVDDWKSEFDVVRHAVDTTKKKLVRF
jgi:hypothetical protein